MTSDPTTSCTTSHYCIFSLHQLCLSSGQQASSDKQHRKRRKRRHISNRKRRRRLPGRVLSRSARRRHGPHGKDSVPGERRTYVPDMKRWAVGLSQVTTWRRCWRAAARTAATRRRTARPTGPAHRTRPPQTKGGTKARRRRAGARRWPTAARPPGPR